MAELLSLLDLPDGFDYPLAFIRVVELGLTELEPWRILQGHDLRVRHAQVAEHYRPRQLVVFAVRRDNDDAACWDLDRRNITVVHGAADPCREQGATFDSFYSWLRQAFADLIEFER